jgi:gliding motility-associated-like protein
VQSFDITIIDDIAPVISGMPSNITQDVDAGTCGAVVNWTLPTAADNCGIPNMSSSHNPGDVFPAGTTTVTYTATDNSGNTDVQSFEITITDNIAPVISGMPSDITQNTDDGICGAKVSWTSPLVNDNCDATVTASHNPGDIFNPGTTTVTYVATDTQGNSVSSSFDVTVIDISAPVISGIPTGIVQNTDIGACGAIVSWDEPDATDNCSATLTSSHTLGDFFDIGETTVVYTASDPYGNMKSASFTVKIEDNNILEFSSCPSIYVIESIDTVQKFAIISWDVPSVNTSCSEVTVSSNYQPGQIFNYGTFTVTYIAKDENGNEATCSFDVSSGYNRSPMVRNSARKATPGETISVVIDAVDPDGHQLIIKSIENNKNNSVISSISYQNLTFEYTPFDNFFGRDTVSIVISDDGSPPSSVVALFVFEVEQPLNVEVSSAITTNGDMINDQWQLRNIERYPNNSVYIYDRWGGLIYHDKGYDNQSVVWSGNINRSGSELVPTGTYFYVINLGDGYGKLTGAVEVIR